MEHEQIEIAREAEDEESEEWFSMAKQLPQVRNWDGTELYLYRGFWLSSVTLPSVEPFQKHFQALESDVVIVTFPKSGTTWLKALAFSIINRSVYSPSKDNKTHPLLLSNSHDLVPFFDVLYRNNPSPVLDHPHHPVRRIFSTHFPYRFLPPCITRENNSSSSSHTTTPRIIYMCRNPLDQFISSYHFYLKIMPQTRKEHVDDHDVLEQAFDLFCRGIQRAGPSPDHHLEYWKASVERPDKVLFLKYEDCKDDTLGCIKKMAEFLGCPFSQEEETRAVQDIARLCSFETMTSLDVNKTGKQEGTGFGYTNSCFFRKGKVGDWVNYLTPPMAERVHKLMQEKFAGSGLSFNNT